MSFMSRFLIIILLIFNFEIAFSQDTSEIEKLRKTNPQAAVDLAEPLWIKAPKPKPLKLGFALVSSYSDNKQYKKAIDLSNQLLSFDNIPKELHAKILLNLIEASQLSKQWDKTQELSLELEKIYPSISNNTLRSKLHKAMGLFYYRQFNLTKAEEHYIQAAEEVKEEKTDRLAGIYRNIGVTQAQQGKLSEATQSMLLAVKMHNDVNSSVPAALYSNLAGLSMYLKDWDKSIEYSNLAVAVSKPNTLSISTTYMNLGTAYVEKGDYENASLYLKKSIEISNAHGKDNPSALNNLGFLEKKMGQIETALKTFLLVEKQYNSQGKVEHAAVAKKNIGESYVALGQREQAVPYFEQAYKIYIENSFRPKLIELYEPMIENLEVLGKYQQALELMREYKQFNDEMVNIESNKSIAEIQSAFDLEKKQKELFESEKQLAELEHKKILKDKAFIELQLAQEELKTIRFGLIFVVVALFIIGVILFRANRFKSKSYQVLSEKNIEIESQHKQLGSLNQRLKQQSLEDPLTGLNNRRYLNQFLDKNIARLERDIKNNKNASQLIILIDLDNFKQINDQYGHSAGDQVLRVFAETIRLVGRESDVLVRWGGEEFLWLCVDTNFLEGIQLCERVRKKFAETSIEYNGQQIKPTCSLGFAPFPIWGEPKSDWEDSLKIADTALYHAKYSGRNRTEGYVASENITARPSGDLDVEALIKNNSLIKAN